MSDEFLIFERKNNCREYESLARYVQNGSVRANGRWRKRISREHHVECVRSKIGALWLFLPAQWGCVPRLGVET